MLIVRRICTQARTSCVSLPATPTSPTADGIPVRASTARCSFGRQRGAHIALNGVKIRTLSLDPAVVEVRVKTTAPGTVRLTVDDLPAMQQGERRRGRIYPDP